MLTYAVTGIGSVEHFPDEIIPCHFRIRKMTVNSWV